MRNFRSWLEIPLVAALVLLIVGGLWWFRGEPGMTWDEPYFFERSRAVVAWLEVARDRPAAAFEKGRVEAGWPFCREVPNQHPPLPAVLGMATEHLFSRWVGPLRGYRLATVILFALVAGRMFRWVRLRWGLGAAAVAIGALLSDPRPFLHAQLITADSDLGAFWFLAALAHLRASETGRGAAWFGIWAGLAVMCKATGILVLVAAVAWTLLYRPRRGWRPLLLAIVTLPATMLVLNPAWWSNPLGGMLRWVQAFLAYPQKVPVAYLGRVYDSIHTFLPWHNTAVLAGTMVPIGLLALTLIGLAATVGAWFSRPPTPPSDQPFFLPDRAVAGWAALHFLTLLILRMFPFLPAHDGLRQLVPAFFFLPILAAFGAERLGRLGKSRRVVRVFLRGFVTTCLLTAAWETARVHPFEMAYYNPLIGGPRGAQAAGMETTYFWDSATVDVLYWMNHNLPPDATVLIFPPPNVLTFGWEQRWGRLRSDLRFLNLDSPSSPNPLALMRGKRPCYLIFQNRQGLYLPRRPGDSPVFARLAVAPALYELTPERVDGVRLLAIFDGAQFRAVENPRNR